MGIFWEALLIFVLRFVGIAVGTLSTLMTVQGRKFYAMLTNFLSALVYVIAIGMVVANLDNIWNILAYCCGVAVGTLLGMAFEQRLALGFAEVRFISTGGSGDLAEAMRQAGFGVTELYGRGRENSVAVIEVIVPRKSVNALLGIAKSVDEKAIVTVTEARVVRRGYWKPNVRR
jgi:uncharacterized protein YebE (UPF0316 family)